MANKKEKDRKIAIQRYLNGDRPVDVWTSMGYSERWFFKWLERYENVEDEWYEEKSRCPHTNPNRTALEIEEIVKFIRLDLYNQGLFHGAQAIQWRMEELNVKPIPSLRTIGRILSRNELTHKRTGNYVPKGKKYPKLNANKPRVVHQTDFIGPCYLKGPVRFYSLNSVDIATGRCAVEPVEFKGGQNTINGFWETWKRLGMPKYQQVDNEMVFYGSPTYPRAMGKVIRLCLMYGIEPIFIPVSEPWRNGVIEKFNHQWLDKFLHRITMESFGELKMESLSFEQKHNSRYRYSKLGGKTPLESLQAANVSLCLPPTEQPPNDPLPKPKKGKYHLIRFIRSDRKINIFGEKFNAPSEIMYEYVRVTIDVCSQKISIYLDDNLIDKRDYKL